MTWEQACDWVDDIISRYPDDDDRGSYPTIIILAREMAAAECTLDEGYDEEG